MSIDKIYVNYCTKISLNDRFTAIQSKGPKEPSARRMSRRRTQSASLDREGGPPTASLANRKLLEQLEKKHKMKASLKLKRRSLKAVLPTRQRLQNRIGVKKGTLTNAMRLAPKGLQTRSNSLSNIATMKADLIAPALRRSNSTSVLAARLGTKRANSAKDSAQMSQKSPTITRNSLRQRLLRSNSVGNLKRPNSTSNLRRDSKTDANGSTGDVSVPPAKRINRSGLQSSSRSRSGSAINRRLGVKTGLGGGGLRDRPIRGISRRRIARGRVSKKGNMAFNMPSGSKGGGQQGRVSRPRGRGGAASQRSRSKSQSRTNIRTRSRSKSQSLTIIRTRSRSLHSISGRGGRQSRISRGGGRGRGRGRDGRGGRGGGGRAGGGGGGGRRLGRGGPGGRIGHGVRGKAVTPLTGEARSRINKEDLDKELDQYMANTKTNFNEEMDVFMNSSA